jgi:glycosyltransferase involved in cell wall biosynthesis
VVIPLCFEAQKPHLTQRPQPLPRPPGPGTGPLRVLFLGQVILRKGIQYLIKSAQLMADWNVRFDVVGPVGISQKAISSAPDNVFFHGRATRDQIGGWYAQADVFVLPTLSDGFAITQIEAMAYGLPVIATPCCGAVVTDGVDGWIVPPRDCHALAQALHRYIHQPQVLRAHQEQARLKARQFSLEQLGDNLTRLEESLFSLRK